MPATLLRSLAFLAASAAALPAQQRRDDATALQLVDRAIARMGGLEALRGITSARFDVLTQWQRLDFSGHPYADLPSYERHSDLRNYATGGWRNTREFLGGRGQSADVVNDTVAARWFSMPNGGTMLRTMNIAYVTERRELFATSSERTMLLARDAKDLRRLADTTIAGQRHARVAATVEGFPATWFLRASDGLPTLVRLTADETADFGLAPYGVQEVEVWYSNWTQARPGILLANQRDVRRLGVPYKRMTTLSATLNAPAPADSFAIPDSTVAQYLAAERQPMWAAPLDSARVVANDYVQFVQWLGSAGAVRVGGKWVLLETAQAEGAAQRASDWLRANAGGEAALGIVARTGTANGGAAWFTAARRPLLVAPGARGTVAAVLRHQRGAMARVTVAATGWQRVGTDSLRLEVLDLPDAHGTLTVYSPTLKWLYLPSYGVPAHQADYTALIDRLRAKGMPVEFLGTSRAVRMPAPGAGSHHPHPSS